MDFSYLKFILYFNKHSVSGTSELCKSFNISKNEAHEIITTLYKNGYLAFSGNSYTSTYKSKHFIKSFILSFININLVDILALIVSIIALIISILK